MRSARSTKDGIRLAEEGQWSELIKRLPRSPELAEQRDPYGMLPLHWACTEHNIPLDAIRALLLAFPEGGMTRNDSQLLPLHVAIRANARSEVLSMLCSMCPDSIWVKMPDGLRALAMATMSGLDRDCIRILQKADEKYRFAHPEACEDENENEESDPAYEATMRDLYRQSQVMRESLRDSMLFTMHFEPSFGDSADQEDPMRIQEVDDDNEDDDGEETTSTSTTSRHLGDDATACGVCDKPFTMFRKRYMCAMCHVPLCKAHVAGKLRVAAQTDKKQRVCAECMIQSRHPSTNHSCAAPGKATTPTPPAVSLRRPKLASDPSSTPCQHSANNQVEDATPSRPKSVVVPPPPSASSPRSFGERPTLSSTDTSICSVEVDDRHLVQVVKALELRNGLLEARVLEQERQHNQAMLLLTQTMTRLAELELALRHRPVDDEDEDDDAGQFKPSRNPLLNRHSLESTCSVEFPNPFTERFSE
ncbi:hypothetical protein H310_06862 [Aphanomyces invadans]|uniref:FYVE-type domain-containing protein n=1 Tax=Aphanomyces invadans TaxID=157072 RepID=A0A024U5Y5_9STRA|nr:hypothetical protein H310_06862 [Aphanomyces invadans]ETW01297.1 hypothetical protein H310_06862 [Aphanomyces invadans]RHY33542.1 hypothetical protein DYB32_002053 [Aphanomyces invadans]|eukprot:XP_008870295.1 hypothetical protein H310_06862 [Aphanomyces invadans]